MFSKRFLTIVCLILFALINIIFLSFSVKHHHSNTVLDRIVMAAIAPFQEGMTQTIHFCEHIWSHYFNLLTVKQECDHLKKVLAKAKLEKSQYAESQHCCQHLRKLLELKDAFPQDLVAARVVGVDPSRWFKAIIIDIGTSDGIAKGMAVIAPEGVVGQIVSVSYDYSKVMLIIDRSSAVDALVQRTRSRGIVEGQTNEYCRFKYVVRKADISIEDTIVSSGFDGIFPRGLRIGYVKEISRAQPGIFQEITVTPFVDFPRLEEVLVIVE